MGKKFLSSLLIAGFLFASCNTTQEDVVETVVKWQEAEPLREIYSENFMMGNIIRNTGDFSNSSRFGILKRHYAIVTAENDMKPDHLAPANNPGSVSVNWGYRFGTADIIVNNAITEGLKVHGHTLIWHSQSPAWLAAGGEDYLNKFVTDVVDHFKGKLISWDVVNEAFRDGLDESDAANWKNCLRGYDNPNGSPWYKSMGPDYIEKAFLAARAADPDAMLYYNDYSLNNAAKSLAVYNMVSEINSKYPDVGGRPLIDGIGMQSHHHINTDPQTVDTAIKLFALLGVEVSITELDICAADYSNVKLGPWDDNAARLQAQKYAAMFRVFKENAEHIARVTFWGLDDETSWRKDAHPTLLDKDYKLKPAFYAVMNPSKY
jgi:endo-1,4-beta-xylanase